MKTPWTKKCTCENFLQNEGCEHIGNEVLKELGMLDETKEEFYKIFGEFSVPDLFKFNVGLVRRGFTDEDVIDFIKQREKVAYKRINKDIERLTQISKQLIFAGSEVGDRNGLPYCKNCGLNLISLGNEIGCMTDTFNH